MDEKYCSNCGRPVQPPRIDGKYIISEIGSVLSFKKGILYTIRELLFRPGKSIRAFILEDRYRLVKPVIFIIFCSFLYTILQQLLGFEDGYINYDSETQSTALTIFQWIQSNYGYANILMAIFMAGWIKILFRKYDYNFYEILILLFYVVGVSMLIYALFGLLETITGVNPLYFGGGLVGIIYSSWAIGQFFDGRKVFNYVKAFLSSALGLISFIVSAVLLGLIIDTVINSI
ncbi:MAG: DUF3667 domain-containing protein [Bacteroidota bacterium]